MNQITDNLCIGCGTCTLVCPPKCIILQPDRLQRLTTQIDNDKCINCNLCKKICPQNDIGLLHYPKDCYVAWSKNKKDWVYSASGGVGAVVAAYQTSKGGYICGCDYDSSLNLTHSCTNDATVANCFRSSKYSQSSAYVSFPQIRLLLSQRKSVVFIGTPCQVNGLRKYLANMDSSSLITIDLVCHGTPPNEYLKQYIHNDLKIIDVSKIRFRGEYDQKMTVWSGDDICYQNDNQKDCYFSAFYQNMISYDACYECQYAQNKRCSDITIGDFWGIGALKSITQMNGRPSLVLLNTEKGKCYFDEVKNDLFYEQRDVSEGLGGNGRLNCPPHKNRKAFLFCFFYPMMGFSKSKRLSIIVDTFINICKEPLIICRRICRKAGRIVKAQFKDINDT